MTVDVRLEINQAVVDSVINSESGPLAEFLLQTADFVVEQSRSVLTAVQYTRGGPIHGRNPSNIPRRRTGDLADHVRAEPPVVDDKGLVVYVITDPVHADPRFGGHYSLWLRENNYRFLPEEPYYHYDPIG